MAVGVRLLVGANVCIFRWSPRRHQPSWSWLTLGALLSVTLVLIVTIALGAIFSLSSNLGQTYGPLAGFVALLLWTVLTSIALLYGVAVAAQLEAVRAGVPAPAQTRRGGRGHARTDEIGGAGPNGPGRRGLVTTVDMNRPHERPRTGPTRSAARSRASSGSRPRRGTSSTCSSTATGSSPRCSRRSARRSARSIC